MELTNSQYAAIMQGYERQQFLNHDLHLARYEEVCRRIPEYRDLDASVASLSVSYGRRLLIGEERDMEGLKRELADMDRKKEALLNAAGFPSDYLEPIYRCSDCHDTGYIGNEKCHCFKQAVVRLIYEQSNMREFPLNADFSHFRLDYYPATYYDKKTGRSAQENIKEVLKSCHQFVTSFGEEFNNLFFYGSVGVGKTFLSTCIAREIIEKEYSVLYFSAPQLFNCLAQTAFDKDNLEARTVADFVYSCDLLIIDDLGSEYTNSFTSSQFFSCINERLLHKKPTIISTNLSLDSLANLYTERSFSRITSNYTLLKIIGDDIRLKKKLEN